MYFYSVNGTFGVAEDCTRNLYSRETEMSVQVIYNSGSGSDNSRMAGGRFSLVTPPSEERNMHIPMDYIAHRLSALLPDY